MKTIEMQDYDSQLFFYSPPCFHLAFAWYREGTINDGNNANPSQEIECIINPTYRYALFESYLNFEII